MSNPLSRNEFRVYHHETRLRGLERAVLSAFSDAAQAAFIVLDPEFIPGNGAASYRILNAIALVG